MRKNVESGMRNLSLKEFITELTTRLETFSHEDLKCILLKHAKALQPVSYFWMPDRVRHDGFGTFYKIIIFMP